ncbi:hypothetical protein Hanom_Chr17g01553311 [Helianthus anomalus]
MDGVNEPGENGKISNLLDPDAKNKPLDESRKTGEASGTKMAYYSKRGKKDSPGIARTPYYCRCGCL